MIYEQADDDLQIESALSKPSSLPEPPRIGFFSSLAVAAAVVAVVVDVVLILSFFLAPLADGRALSRSLVHLGAGQLRSFCVEQSNIATNQPTEGTQIMATLSNIPSSPI